MSFGKGHKVFTRYRWGDRRGQVDTTREFIIRSIGKKRAILDLSNPVLNGYRQPGSTYYIYTPEEIAERYGNGYNTSWDQVFAHVGEEGFDAKENY